MLTLATIVLLVAGAFTDVVSCHVEGYIYKDKPDEAISMTRADTCHGVRVSTDESKLVLQSPHIWVVIPIGVDKGHRRLIYRWGAEVAHIDAETVPVQWGRVQRG